jgi:hypothetical protein
VSHIDTFKHEIIGKFGVISVYHPLQDINGDFICGPDNILVGGGSGEWPAIVIRNPTAAVAEFIAIELMGYDSEDSEDEWPIVKYKDEWQEIIAPYLNLPHNKIIEFCEWTVEDYVRFEKLCCSDGLQNPFDAETHELGFENWFILGIGEFIFYSMPELASDIMSKLDNPYKYFQHINYNNIMLIPPNMPVYANGGNAFFPPKKT